MPSLATLASGPIKCLAVEAEGLARLPQSFRDNVRVDENGCWLWLGAKTPKGYARYCPPNRRKLGLNQQNAHRWAFKQLIDPTLPDDAFLDHERTDCDKCANPWHCEPVTTQENTARWAASVTHCPRGHEYSKENTRVDKRGRRECKSCQRVKARSRYHGLTMADIDAIIGDL